MRTGQASVRIQNEQILFKKQHAEKPGVTLVTFFNKRHYEVRFHRIVKINSQNERKNHSGGEGYPLHIYDFSLVFWVLNSQFDEIGLRNAFYWKRSRGLFYLTPGFSACCFLNKFCSFWMRTEACPVRNQNEQNLFKKQELECVLNLSIVDLRLDVSSMGRKKIQTWSIHGPTRKDLTCHSF